MNKLLGLVVLIFFVPLSINAQELYLAVYEYQSSNHQYVYQHGDEMYTLGINPKEYRLRISPTGNSALFYSGTFSIYVNKSFVSPILTPPQYVLGNNFSDSGYIVYSSENFQGDHRIIVHCLQSETFLTLPKEFSLYLDWAYFIEDDVFAFFAIDEENSLKFLKFDIRDNTLSTLWTPMNTFNSPLDSLSSYHIYIGEAVLTNTIESFRDHFSDQRFTYSDNGRDLYIQVTENKSGVIEIYCYEESRNHGLFSEFNVYRGNEYEFKGFLLSDVIENLSN